MTKTAINDFVLQIVKMTPAEQYDLAFKVAENIGCSLRKYPLRPETTPEMLEAARQFVLEKPSTSYIQRKLGIGYNHASEIMEQFEAEGLISPRNSSGIRHIQVGPNGPDHPIERAFAADVVGGFVEMPSLDWRALSQKDCSDALYQIGGALRRMRKFDLANGAEKIADELYPGKIKPAPIVPRTTT